MSSVRRRLGIALAVLGVGLAVLGVVVLTVVGLTWMWAVIIGVALGGVVASGLYLGSWRFLLRLTGGHSPTGVTGEIVINVLEGLCISHGIAPPELRIIQSDSINALAIARTPTHAALIITRGAVEYLDRIELEGLMAHHLCRIRRGDAAYETLMGALLAWPLGAFSRIRNRVLRRVLPVRRNLEIDFDAVAMTRYPPGLLAVLVTLTHESIEVPSPTMAVSHMWFSEPGGVRTGTRLEDRIAALDEL